MHLNGTLAMGWELGGWTSVEEKKQPPILRAASSDAQFSRDKDYAADEGGVQRPLVRILVIGFCAG